MQPTFGLRRQKLVKENVSEYFFKDLIIEPRQNQVLKTHCDPFKLENMDIKDRTAPIILAGAEGAKKPDTSSNSSACISDSDEAEEEDFKVNEERMEVGPP